ncbi:MAG: glycosyltransferase [Gemmatimonadaceae bacterium]|nr:glycosyltransferase [Gemmatimonadaceae bacterium]
MTVRLVVDAARPRILHIITGLGTGGAEASLLRVIARSTPDATHAVVSLTTAGTRGVELQTLGIDVHTLGLARGAIAPRALGALRRLVREFRPTAVQGWMYHGNLAASLLALSGAHTGPVLWNVRHALDAWSEESRVLRAIIRVSALIARQPRRIVYNSHRSASQHMARGYTAASTCVIPNGVDIDRFRPDRNARIRIRQELGIPSQAFVVGLIARVDPLKDHDTFLDAVKRHATADRDTWYLLAGTGTAPGQLGARGPLDVRIRRLMSAHPELVSRVLRLGERRDIPAVMNACDVVTLSSRSEGSPNAITEAMACGVPCVVTDVGDAAHMVGDTGMVVRVGDAGAIAAAWRQLRADRTVLAVRGQRAVERVRTSFSAQREGEAYMSLWAQTSVARTPPVPSTVGNRSTASAPRVLMVATVATTVRAFLLPLADRFRAHGWRVDALAAGADTDGVIAPHFDSAFGIAWGRNPFSGRNLSAIRRIRDVTRAGAYDIVHVHTPIAAFLTRFALRHDAAARVVYTAHGFHAHPAGSRIRNALFRWIERRAARWTDYLVVMNAHDAELACRDRLAAAGHLVQHPGIGVDVTRYRPLAPAERERVRQGLGVDSSRPVVAVVGEFNRNKRQHDVVAALARLRDEATHAIPLVWFIGEGPLRPAVTRHARALGVDMHVRFLGQRDDCPALVGAADALVLASTREGLPRCLLEAMAMEVPAIASSARGSTDLLGDDRGWLYPIGDVARLADRLRIVLTDRESTRTRVLRASAWIRQVAAQEHVLDLHEALYDAVRRGVPVPESGVTPTARIPHGSIAGVSSAA